MWWDKQCSLSWGSVFFLLLIVVGIVVIATHPQGTPEPPDDPVKQAIAEQTDREYDEQQRQEQERRDTAGANWQKTWDDMGRDLEARARKQRAYQLGEADGEGYGEQQARGRKP